MGLCRESHQPSPTSSTGKWYLHRLNHWELVLDTSQGESIDATLLSES